MTVTLRQPSLLAGYLLLLLVPLLATLTLDMDNKGIYLSILSGLNLLAIAAFFLQFPMAGRIRRLAQFANIDWNISKHKTVGKWLGVFILLHPILILAPRFMQSYTDGITSLEAVITAPQMLTGIIAWLVMLVWTLLAVFKNRLPISYETWHLTHVLGFVVIAVLATFHITSVGSHGQYANWFNGAWWGLCALSIALVVYNQIWKKLNLRGRPFTLQEVKKVSSRDWQITLLTNEHASFVFEAGQFVWLNTSSSPFNMNEHPFSIASSRADLPNISFIIRELGDYTSRLDELEVGQDVYVDGPYGSMSLLDSRHSEVVVLIAGGAGIGPMLSLLNQLAADQDSRPIRLIYGNKDADQMVLQNEIKQLEKQMPNFKQYLVCEEFINADIAYQGVIDQACLEQLVGGLVNENTSVYLCGPEGMINAVNHNLATMGMPATKVHFEQLSF